MSTKFFILVLSTFLLVQFAHGNAIGKISKVSTSSEETNTITKKDTSSSEEIQQVSTTIKDSLAALQVYAVAKNEMLNLVDATYNFTRTAFEPLIADISVTEKTTKSAWEEKLEKVKQLYEKSKNLNKADDSEKSDFIDGLYKIFNNFEETVEPTANLSQSDRDIIKVVDSIKTEIRKNFTTTSDHLLVAVEKYWNSLSRKTQKKDKAYYDAYMKAKNEPDVMRKIDYLGVLFPSDDSSEEKQ